VTFKQAFGFKVTSENLSNRVATLVNDAAKELGKSGAERLPTDLKVDSSQSPEEAAKALVSLAIERSAKRGDDNDRAVSQKSEDASESEDVAAVRSQLIEVGKRLREMMTQTEDRRAAAQLYLILIQVEKLSAQGNTNEVKTALAALEKISEGGSSLIQDAVKKANEAEERTMERNGINIRSDQSNVVEGNLEWEQTFCNCLHLPRSFLKDKRPDFKDLALGEGCRSSFVALGKLVEGIEHVLTKSDNRCNTFLTTKIAQNAAGNRDFDLPTRLKADLLSQLGPQHLDAIEGMAKRYPEEFKAFTILAALWCHFGTGDQSGYFSPQLPPGINPAVQGLAQIIRDGNIAPQGLNETFGELLKEQKKAITGQ
jgi:hypothetical protein